MYDWLCTLWVTYQLLKYLTGGDSPFKIDATTGTISTTRSLNLDDIGRHVIQVQASNTILTSGVRNSGCTCDPSTVDVIINVDSSSSNVIFDRDHYDVCEFINILQQSVYNLFLIKQNRLFPMTHFSNSRHTYERHRWHFSDRSRW